MTIYNQLLGDSFGFDETVPIKPDLVSLTELRHIMPPIKCILFTSVQVHTIQ
jgi:hypothetical protein